MEAQQGTQASHELKRSLEGSGTVAEIAVSREKERNRVLMQWFSVWTMVPASLSDAAPGHNLLLS